MGFGHRVYKVKDPRATVLQELAEHVFAETGRPKLYDMAVELERIVAGISGRRGFIPTSISTPASSTEPRHPARPFTPIFAIARVAGWLAHWLEQLKNNRIFRPEQIYVGKRDQRMCRWKRGRERSMSRLAVALEQIDFARRYTRSGIEVRVRSSNWFTIPPGGVTQTWPGRSAISRWPNPGSASNASDREQALTLNSFSDEMLLAFGRDSVPAWHDSDFQARDPHRLSIACMHACSKTRSVSRCRSRICQPPQAS